jgi:hypothetical protein
MARMQGAATFPQQRSMQRTWQRVNTPGGIDPWLAETGGSSTIRFRCTGVARFATGYGFVGICESPGSSEAFSNEDLDIPLAQALDG